MIMNYWGFLLIIHFTMIRPFLWDWVFHVIYLKNSVLVYTGWSIISWNLLDVSTYLMTFLFMGPPNSDLCLQTLQQFFSMPDDIGIPIKNEKTILPMTVITFLGLWLDNVAMELRLPEDKLTNLWEKLIYFKTRKKFTLRELQSLIGLLNFACTVVKPGRAFLRCLIDFTLGLKRPNHRRWLTKESRPDLNSKSVFVIISMGNLYCLSWLEKIQNN